MNVKPINLYADLEIRILARQTEGYPVEFTFIHQGSQEFKGGMLTPEILSWQPGASPHADGEALYQLLMADAQLRQDWAELRGKWPRRRIRLIIDEAAPELHAIPWELLREHVDGKLPQTLATTSDTPFSRYMAGRWPPGRSIDERPVKMLVVIANPANLASYNLPPIDVEAEVKNISETCAELVQQGHLELSFLPQPITLSNLEAALRKPNHFLHIIAHGMYSRRRGEGVLYLADETNQIDLVGEQSMATMVNEQSHKPRFVFLANCQSATRDTSDAFHGLAPALIMAGVPVVLAMQDYISSATDQVFTRSFYQRLFMHGQVDLACNEARSTLQTQGFSGTGIPVLFSRLRDNQLLSNLPKAVMADRQGHLKADISDSDIQVLQKHLMNLADDVLTAFCYDQIEPVYSQLTGRESRLTRVVKLIDYCRKKGALTELLRLRE